MKQTVAEVLLKNAITKELGDNRPAVCDISESLCPPPFEMLREVYTVLVVEGCCVICTIRVRYSEWVSTTE